MSRGARCVMCFMVGLICVSMCEVDLDEYELYKSINTCERFLVHWGGVLSGIGCV